jgi:hypothetical protein
MMDARRGRALKRRPRDRDSGYAGEVRMRSTLIFPYSP